jgi:saccharopine dehydrogenase (NAD+, L-lysine-forming)
MRVLVLGAGGVGEVAARGLARARGVEHVTVADVRPERAHEVVQAIHTVSASAAAVDASDGEAVARAAAGHDAVVHAGLPRHNLTVMEACLEAGAHYLDMASDGPVELPGLVTVQQQMRYDERFRARGLIALLGIGVDPGLTNIFARYASEDLDRMDEVVVYDGDNSVLRGHEFALPFSPETSIEECLQPPLSYRDGRFVQGEPLDTGVEVFEFPRPVGPLTVRSVSHEETGTIPLFWPGLRRCEFKYALSDEYVAVLRVLKKLGFDREEPVLVDGHPVVPRKVVAALLPEPARLAEELEGHSCVGTWVKGVKDGQEVEQYIYTLSSHADARRLAGANVTVWQAGTPPVLAVEMIADGTIRERGALVPEQLDPNPWIERLPAWGMPVYVWETRLRTATPLAPRSRGGAG